MLNNKTIALELSEKEGLIILSSFEKMKVYLLENNNFLVNYTDRLKYEELVLLEDKLSRIIYK